MRPAAFQIILPSMALALVLNACGGPTNVDPPGPTQTVQAYWAGDDSTKTIHVHVDFVQNGKALVLRTPCVPQDNCRLYGLSQTGRDLLGIPDQSVIDLESGSGTLTDPGITFTVRAVNGRTYTFTGTVAESKQMRGKFSGGLFPSPFTLQLDKQP